MQLTERVDQSGSTNRCNITVRVIDGWYEIEEDGHQHPMPVMHYNCRDEDGTYRHVSESGFRPYFFVAATDVSDEQLGALQADRRVLDVSRAERTGIDSGERGIPLLRVTVVKPYHVAQLRDSFTRSFDADVLFPDRYLIDRDVNAYARVPDTDGRVDSDDITGVEDPDTTILPRIAYWDIEVATGDALSVVPGDYHEDTDMPNVDAPRKPITSVTLYDDETDEYEVIALRGETPAWTTIEGTASFGGDMSVTLTVVDNERDLIKDVAAWFTSHRPNILTGWNSNAFDWPYYVNRAYYLDELSVTAISPTGNVDEHDGGGRFVNSDVGGLHLVDMMDAYKKSQYTELKSYALADVAAAETNLPKMDVDEQQAYTEDPQRFLDYNLRDVASVVAINEEVGLL